jgi:hypothetical protein
MGSRHFLPKPADFSRHFFFFLAMQWSLKGMNMGFKGTLREFKVPDILQLLSLQQKTGILTFTAKEGFITLIFEKGFIVGVDAFPKKIGIRVGHVLVKQDFISDEMLQRALAIQKRTNQRIGEILQGMGLINQGIIEQALKTQTIEIVLSLFKWKKGEYNFKIMDVLEDSMRVVDPIPTDNLIMEGVQMLDEWPLIKKMIPDDEIVFAPNAIDPKDVILVDEYDEYTPKGNKIYLSEQETNLLKHINGQNRVRDLVELGLFTEYKVYKNLFNLLRKDVIEAKADIADRGTSPEAFFLQESRNESDVLSEKAIPAIILILLIILLITFQSPLRPFQKKSILFDDHVYSAFTGTEPEKPAS